MLALEKQRRSFRTLLREQVIPLNTVLRFNVPTSVVSSGKGNVPSATSSLTGMRKAKLTNY